MFPEIDVTSFCSFLPLFFTSQDNHCFLELGPSLKSYCKFSVLIVFSRIMIERIDGFM